MPKNKGMPPFLQNTKVLHALSWLAYFAVLIMFFSSTVSLQIAVIKSAQTVFLHALLFYLNILFLMPHFLDRKKYLVYFTLLIMAVVALVAVLYFVNFQYKPLSNVLLNNKGFNPPLAVKSAELNGLERIKAARIVGRVLRYFSSTIAIILLSVVYKMARDKMRNEQRDVQLKAEYLMTEMKFLKSQINPHFLFNALNNVYSLVQLKDDKAPEMLMRLSDMLRYMLYECNDEYIPIEKEINYINNYIELQHLKTQKRQHIHAEYHISSYSIRIPPLLLIPFIENAFKHGNVENIEKGRVDFSLSLEAGHLHFKITNSLAGGPQSKDKTGGIGLENIKRRLQLLYADHYQLQIEENNREFIVELNIEWNENEVYSN